uniref:Uncharacterized protein n=1 Tax=Rousettus aegyptiacus TaxID=9407 RepID=A0A7J8IKP9_ROUAE|nr:hypothetical protein HJG63_010475 [Rousettus aegyptiacus]
MAFGCTEGHRTLLGACCPSTAERPAPCPGLSRTGATVPRSPGGGTSGCLAAPRCARLLLSTWLVRAAPGSACYTPVPLLLSGPPLRSLQGSPTQLCGWFQRRPHASLLAQAVTRETVAAWRMQV